MAVKGVGGVLGNLKRVKSKVDRDKRKALTRVGAIVKRGAVKNAPIDTGNLRSSSFTEVNGTQSVTVGFTANYAVFVHENMEGNFNKGGPKFLEKAVQENADRILEEFSKGGL